MNKRADLTALFILIIVGIVSVVIFAGWYYGNTLFLDTIRQVPATASLNLTEPIEQTFGQVNESLRGLKWVALGMFFGMFMAIFISNYLVKANPVYSFVYIAIVIFAIIMSFYVSNAYEDVLLNSVLRDTLINDFSPTNHILLKLPLYVTIVGFVGGIFLFINSGREEGGLI